MPSVTSANRSGRRLAGVMPGFNLWKRFHRFSLAFPPAVADRSPFAKEAVFKNLVLVRSHDFTPAMSYLKQVHQGRDS
jgi:hypothetical protein